MSLIVEFGSIVTAFGFCAAAAVTGDLSYLGGAAGFAFLWFLA